MYQIITNCNPVIFFRGKDPRNAYKRSGTMKNKLLAMLLLAVTLVTLCAPVAGYADTYTGDREGYSGYTLSDSGTVSKTAAWVMEDGELTDMADITVTSQNSRLGSDPVLFLGTMCTSHGLTAETITDSINTIAQFADVEYQLFGAGYTGTNQVSASGTVKKGEELTTTQTSNITGKTAGSQHVSQYKFAEVLASAAANNKEYSLIVMEFDGLRMGCTNYQPTEDDAKNTVAAAEYLKTYYAKDRVLWVLPDENYSTDDYKTNTYIYDDQYFSTTYAANVDAYVPSSQTKNPATYNYQAMMYLLEPDDTQVTGKYVQKKNGSKSIGYYPTLKNAENADYTKDTAPQITDQTTLMKRLGYSYNGSAWVADASGKIWVSYTAKEAAISFLKQRLAGIFETVAADDVVAGEFGTIVSITPQYIKSGGTTWTNVCDPIAIGAITETKTGTDASGNFTYTVTPQADGTNKLLAKYNTSETALNTTQVRTIVRVKLDSDGKAAYQTAGAAGKTTNAGDVVLAYTVNSATTVAAQSSPTIARFDRALKYQFVGDILPQNATAPATQTKTFIKDDSDTYKTLSVFPSTGTSVVTTDTATAAPGYTFSGWYEDESCTTPAAASYDLKEFTSDKTLYGKWSLALTAGKSATPSTVNAGEEITYTITVENPTAGKCEGVTVTDTLDTDKVGYVLNSAKIDGATPAEGKFTSDSGTLTWTVDVPANGRTVITYSVKALETLELGDTKIQNTAKVSYQGQETSSNTTETAVSYILSYVVTGDKTYGSPSFTTPSEETDIASGASKALAEAPTTGDTTATVGAESIDGTWSFAGWYTDAACTAAAADPLTITKNTTVYGKWSFAPADVTITYTVTGDPTYGSPADSAAPSPQTVDYGNDGTLAAALVTEKTETVAGVPGTWSFTGWCTDAACETTPVTSLTGLTANATVYGKWSFTPQPLTIVYKLTEDSVTPTTYTTPADVTGKSYGDSYTFTAPAAIAGYSFTGWCKEAALTNNRNGEQALNSDTFTIENGVITVYGKWALAVSMEKSVSAATATAGDQLSYTITLKNTGAKPALFTDLSDTLDANLTFVSATAEGACSDGVITWPDQTVPAGQELNITVVVTTNKNLTADTPINNTATGKVDGRALTADSSATTVSPRDIRVVYHYTGDVPAGETPPEDGTVSYGGSYTAASLPSQTGYSFDGWFTDASCTQRYATTNLTADVTDLYGKWTLTKTFTAEKEVLYIPEGQTDPVSVNNGTVAAGTTLTYAITVTNTSVAAVSNVVVSDSVPAGLTYVASSATEGGVYSDGTVTWTLSALDAGATKTLRFNATVPSAITENTAYKNTAAVVSAGGTPVSTSTNETSTTGKPLPGQVRLTKAWSDTWDAHTEDSVQIQVTGTAGGETCYDQTYTLTYDKKYVDMELDSVTAENQPITYTFRELNASSEPVAEGELNNGYKVTYATEGSSWTVKNVYQITPEDLTLQKTAAETAVAGETFNYVLKVKNTRTYETATGIVVQDTLPAGLTTAFTEENPQPAGLTVVTEQSSGQQVCTWTIESLAAGEEATLTIPVLVPEGTEAQEYQNTAYIIQVGETTCSVPSGNTPVVTDVRSFTVSKKWTDTRQTHDSVTVELYKGAESQGTVTLNDTNGWTYTWNELPLYEGGAYLVYTVKETTKLTGYKEPSIVYSGGDYGNTGAVVTNEIEKITAGYVFKGAVPEGVSAPTSDTLEYGADYTAASTDTITARGYTFTGWYTDETCQTPYATQSLTEDTVLYGLWTRNEVTVSYEYSGDVPAGATPPAEQTINQYATPTAPADPSNYEGYKFDGWFTDPEGTTPYVPGETETDTKIYGHWSSVKITYSFTGDVPGDATLPEGEEHWAPGDTYTASTLVGTPEHYRFDGWYTDEACTQKYEDGTSVSANTMLYGKWVKQYTVSYEYTGTVPGGVTPPESSTLDEGSPVSPADKPSASGYSFDGWYLDPDCTVAFAPSMTLSEDTVLYGKWTKNTTPQKPNQNQYSDNVADTGDDATPGLWLALLAVSGLGLGAALCRKKERE